MTKVRRNRVKGKELEKMKIKRKNTRKAATTKELRKQRKKQMSNT